MTIEEFNELVDNATLETIRESRLKPFAELASGVIEDAALTYTPSSEFREWLRG